MRVFFLTFLGREWSALAISAIVAALGVVVLDSVGWPGLILIAAAVVLAIGSIVHLFIALRSRRRHPAPGKMVDLGGYRVHVRAEGSAKGKLPIVWFGGGHSAGLTMDHVHRQLREDTRSILIDRPGTGWSDTGPFPRTTAREAEELVAALRLAGEEGPFVFAGYSFGGLLAANIARRHPELVARLALIDPTPLETIVFGPRLSAIRKMRRTALCTALLRLCGVHFDLGRYLARKDPTHEAATSAFEQQLGGALDELRAVEASAGARLAEYDIYRELIGSHIGTCGWETVVYDGDLGDMSVWLIAPGNAEEVKANPDIAKALGSEGARMINFFATSRERYMATSTNARRVVAPEGTTHQFVYERPDFIVETMRAAIIP